VRIELKQCLKLKLDLAEKKLKTPSVKNTDYMNVQNSLNSFLEKQKKVREEFNKKELNGKEIYWIKFHNCKFPNGYNHTDGGDGGSTCKGVPKSEEHKRKISLANLKHYTSEETKEKIRDANTGKKRTEETKRKMSETRKGKKHNNGLLGHKHAEETKEKIRKASTGRRHTEESNEKNRQSHLGKEVWNKGKPVFIEIVPSSRIFTLIVSLIFFLLTFIASWFYSGINSTIFTRKFFVAWVIFYKFAYAIKTKFWISASAFHFMSPSF